MSISDSLHIIGYACGLGAADHNCCFGPLVLQDSTFLRELTYAWRWVDNLFPQEDKYQLDAMLPISQLCKRLAQHTQRFTQQKCLFATIGGDQSLSLGTWSGVSAAIEGPLGLLWVDAHMDAHTPQTSPTHNIHGMPLACLLGHGHASLTQILNEPPTILPEHTCLVGVRSFEPEEAALLETLKVKVFFMQEIEERGLEAVMADALTIINNNTAGYGISIDMDAIDPTEAPGTGYLEPNGLHGKALCHSLSQLQNYPNLLGIEITEFNPRLDQEQKTEKLIVQLIQSILESLPTHASVSTGTT